MAVAKREPTAGGLRGGHTSPLSRRPPRIVGSDRYWEWLAAERKASRPESDAHLILWFPVSDLNGVDVDDVLIPELATFWRLALSAGAIWNRREKYLGSIGSIQEVTVPAVRGIAEIIARDIVAGIIQSLAHVLVQRGITANAIDLAFGVLYYTSPPSIFETPLETSLVDPVPGRTPSALSILWESTAASLDRPLRADDRERVRRSTRDENVPQKQLEYFGALRRRVATLAGEGHAPSARGDPRSDAASIATGGHVDAVLARWETLVEIRPWREAFTRLVLEPSKIVLTALLLPTPNDRSRRLAAAAGILKHGAPARAALVAAMTDALEDRNLPVTDLESFVYGLVRGVPFAALLLMERTTTTRAPNDLLVASQWIEAVATRTTMEALASLQPDLPHADILKLLSEASSEVSTHLLDELSRSDAATTYAEDSDSPERNEEHSGKAFVPPQRMEDSVLDRGELMARLRKILFDATSVGIPIPVAEYGLRLAAFGALEGPAANPHITPDVLRLFTALHHVLAGGEVAITIGQRGNPEIVRQLESMLPFAARRQSAPAVGEDIPQSERAESVREPSDGESTTHAAVERPSDTEEASPTGGRPDAARLAALSIANPDGHPVQMSDPTPRPVFPEESFEKYLETKIRASREDLREFARVNYYSNYAPRLTAVNATDAECLQVLRILEWFENHPH